MARWDCWGLQGKAVDLASGTDDRWPGDGCAPRLLKGALIGIVSVYNRTSPGAVLGDVDILQAVAGHIATALETARTTQLDAQIVASVHETSALIEHATSPGLDEERRQRDHDSEKYEKVVRSDRKRADSKEVGQHRSTERRAEDSTATRASRSGQGR